MSRNRVFGIDEIVFDGIDTSSLKDLYITFDLDEKKVYIDDYLTIENINLISRLCHILFDDSIKKEVK